MSPCRMQPMPPQAAKRKIGERFICWARALGAGARIRPARLARKKMFSSLASFRDAIAEGVKEFSDQLNDETTEVRTNLAGVNERVGDMARRVDLNSIADNVSTRASSLASRVEGAIANPDAVMQNLEGVLNQADNLISSGVERVRRVADEAVATPSGGSRGKARCAALQSAFA